MTLRGFVLDIMTLIEKGYKSRNIRKDESGLGNIHRSARSLLSHAAYLSKHLDSGKPDCTDERRYKKKVN